MILTKLLKSVHGKSAWATYKFDDGKMEVYLMNNEPCTMEWGKLNVMCHVRVKESYVGPVLNGRYLFYDYAEFRQFRKSI